MNNSEVAKNGFKTFLITLTVSLVFFSVVYFFLTGSTKKVDIEQPDLQVAKSMVVASAAAAAKDDSVFYDLSREKVNVAGRAVLAGSTQSTASVPETGSTEITVGFVLSLLALGLGSYVVFL